MKRFSLFVVLCIILLVGGGTPYVYNIYTQTPTGVRVKSYWEICRTKDPSLWAQYYRGWANVGYIDPAKPKNPWTLNYRSTRFMVEIGHPPEFPGYVSGVLVTVGNQEPKEAKREDNGRFYFWVNTGRGKFRETNFSHLPPGIHPIEVEIIWTRYRGPYKEATVDVITRVYGLIEFDPRRTLF